MTPEAVYIHPEWGGKAEDGKNIALVKFSQAINSVPLILPSEGYVVRANDQAVVWSPRGDLSLSENPLYTVIDKSLCQDMVDSPNDTFCIHHMAPESNVPGKRRQILDCTILLSVCSCCIPASLHWECNRIISMFLGNRGHKSSIWSIPCALFCC